MATINSIQDMEVVGNELFFVGDDGIRGPALWKTDGTETGTRLVRDVADGTDPSVGELTNVSGTLYFIAGNFFDGRSLWKSDGTADGTVPVKSEISARHLTNVGGRLFFNNIGTDVTDIDVWTSDGTAAGTHLVKDIVPGEPSYPEALTEMNGTLFFGVDEGVDGIELWKSDGTAEGTTVVKQVAETGSVVRLTNANGTLYSVAGDFADGMQLWASDGTEDGTRLVKRFAEPTLFPTNITEVAGATYFTTFAEGSRLLWRTNGTPEGTVVVKNLNDDQVVGIRGLTNYNGTLLFTTSTSSDEESLWRCDGTKSGTVKVKDLGIGNGSFLNNVDGTLFMEVGFQLGVPTRPSVLWKSDGTSEGTLIVRDFTPGQAGLYSNLFDLSGKAVFKGRHDASGSGGYELWSSDGTPAGTVIVKDINASIGSNGVFDTSSPNTYQEQGQPTAILGPGAFINVPAGVEGGSIRVTYLNGKSSADRISIRNDGLGAGQIAVSGQNVLYEGIVIGKRTATDTQTLTVTLNQNARTVSAQALLRAITYENVNRRSMASGQRKLAIELTDKRGTTYAINRLVNLVSINNAPALQGEGAPIYHINNSPPPVRLLYGVEVIDRDSPNFAGGELAIRFAAGASASDFLTLSGSYKFDSHDNLLHGDVIMGTRIPGGGKQGKDLVITLNEHANALGVAEFLKALRFSTRTPGQRELSYTLTDGDGGTSNTIMSTVNVPANVAPVLTGGGTVNYSTSGTPVAVFSGATVTDADSANFYYGTLLLSYANHQTGDQTILGGPFVLDANNYLVLNRPVDGPLVIGRLTSGGLSSQQLEFTLNAQATAARVQWLLTSIRFSGIVPLQSRELSVTLTDGDGGTSNTIVTTIEVS